MKIWILRYIVGSKTGRIAALVLAVGLILLSMILLWEKSIRDSVTQEIQTEQLKRNLDTREKIDEGLRTAPSDADDSIRWLLNRQQRK